MSDSNQFMLDVLTWLAFALAAWVLLSPFGFGVRWLIDRFMPAGVNRFFLDLWASIPGVGNPLQWLVQRLTALRDRLLAARRIRLGMDNLHTNLATRLKALRTDLAADLAQISAAGNSGGNGTLVGLLQQFDAASTRAHAFEAPDDGLPDYSRQIASAKSKRFWSWFAAIIVGLFNGGLLMVFFRDVPLGWELPGTQFDVAMLGGFLLPLLEFLAGFVPTLMAQEGRISGTAKIAKVVIISALAALEAFIFFLLFQTIANNAAEADLASDQIALMKTAIPFIGVAFGLGVVLLQSMAGQGAAEAQVELKRLVPIQSIKSQLKDAEDFVANLPQRYGDINQVATAARQSVRDFLAQLRQEGDADAPLVNRLDQARQAFLDAIGTVNPERWSPDGPAADGDRDDAFRVAWGSLFLALLCAVVTIACTALLLRPLIGYSWTMAGAAALVITIVSFILLPQLVPRTALVVADGGRRQLWFGSGGDAGRYAAMAFGLIVSLSLLVIGILSQGLSGFVLAVVVIAAMAGIATLGGSLPQLLLGASFVFFALLELAGFALLLLWLALRAVTLWVLWLLCAFAKAVASLIALPITAVLALMRNRRTPAAAQA